MAEERPAAERQVHPGLRDAGLRPRGEAPTVDEAAVARGRCFREHESARLRVEPVAPDEKVAVGAGAVLEARGDGIAALLDRGEALAILDGTAASLGLLAERLVQQATFE